MTTAPAVYAQYRAPVPSMFLFLAESTGLDGTKLSEAQTAVPRTPDQQIVAEASIVGDRETLKADAFIPVTMAIIYLLLFLYFKAIGGYKPVHIDAGEPGREGPAAAGRRGAGKG